MLARFYSHGYRYSLMSVKGKLSVQAEAGERLVGGFIESNGTQAAVKPIRPDEMAVAEMPHPRPWTKLPRVRKTKIALMGIGRAILDQADPRYKRALLLANAYRKVRSAELATMHGYVSSGASALLSSASLALAASRFLYEKVAEGGDITLLKQAASLGDSARQSELAAWEMSAREGAAKRRLDASKTGVPWLQEDSTKAKPGRKTNEERAKRDIEVVGVSQGTLTIDDVLHTKR